MSGSGRFRFTSSLDKPRRRFVQDGEVPVTVLNPRSRHGSDPLAMPRPGSSPLERAEAAEAALETERAARENAERQLREAQAAILDLRTKQGHAELRRMEEDGQATAVREELAALRATLRERDEQVAQLQVALERASAARPVTSRPGRRPARPALDELAVAADATETAVSADEAPATPKRRGPGRPKATASTPARRGRPAAEPKPVKWWIKPTRAAKPAAKRGRPPGSGKKQRV